MEKNSSDEPTHGRRKSRSRPSKGSQLRIHLLGELLIECDQQPVLTAAWSKHKPLLLLQILLTHRNSIVSKDQLIELIWPRLRVKSAINNLRVAVLLIRRALEPVLIPGQCQHYVRTWHDGYSFQTNGAWVDADQFEAEYEAGIKAASQSELELAQSHFDSCIGLFRGQYLQDALYEDWAITERERLKGLYLSSLSGLAGIHGTAGRYENAILILQRILELDDCREVAYSQMMRYQYASGDRVSAVRTFQECRRRLNERLGLSPMPETVALYQQIVSDQSGPSPEAPNALPTLVRSELSGETPNRPDPSF